MFSISNFHRFSYISMQPGHDCEVMASQCPSKIPGLGADDLGRKHVG